MSVDGATHTPTLYLLPVPLSDVDPKEVLPVGNIEIVRRLRFFVVENVRSARRFLKRCDRDIVIDDLSFATLNVNTPAAEVPALLEPMRRGHDMGVISEAGCPAVADPGSALVAEAHSAGFRVVPLVGPSSILMSMMASGFNGQSFAFTGYLPIDSSARTSRLKEMERRIRRESQTQIFIETPYRNNKLIAELCRTLPGDLRLCVASDITGPRENVTTMPLAKWSKATYNYDKTPTIFLLYK